MRERREDKKREKEKQRGRGEFCASPANAFRKLFKSTLMKSKTNSIVPPTPDSGPPPLCTFCATLTAFLFMFWSRCIINKWRGEGRGARGEWTVGGKEHAADKMKLKPRVK